MTTLEKLNNSKIPVIVFDKKLEEFRDKNMFPKKLEQAKAIIKKAGIPNFKK